jgi:hypothetical protein
MIGVYPLKDARAEGVEEERGVNWDWLTISLDIFRSCCSTAG